MARQIALLRGINLGSSRRVDMAGLRDLLTSLGYDDVRTYLQSGNVVLTSGASPGSRGDRSQLECRDEAPRPGRRGTAVPDAAGSILTRMGRHARIQVSGVGSQEGEADGLAPGRDLFRELQL